MPFDSLFTSGLDTECTGAVGELGCSRGPTHYNGAGSNLIRPYGAHTTNQSRIREVQLEITTTNCLAERLSRPTELTYGNSADEGKMRTIEQGVNQTSKVTPTA